MKFWHLRKIGMDTNTAP
uniref:Core region of GTP cyclohydrolase I family protein n=1 Tax=Rhizophora mucronata TaxID=61149 RepID=A0A2P2NTF7_RHIMU